MKKDKFLAALLMTSCLLSVSMVSSAPALAQYTLDQEAEITLWTDYIRDYASDAFGYLSRANIHMDAREFKNAIADYDSALKLDQYNTEAYIKRGTAKYQLQDLDGAMKDFAVAVEINPALYEARFNIGRIYYRTQDYNKAVENMRSAIRFADERSDYHFELARAEYKAGLYSDSYNNFSRAIDLRENYYDAFYGKGLASMNLAQYDAAIQCFDKVLNSNLKYENSNYYKGIAEYQLGQYEAAIKDFDAALAETPDDGLVYNFRGKANELLGNKSAAKKDYKTAKNLGVVTVGLTGDDKSAATAKDVPAEKPKVSAEKDPAIIAAAAGSLKPAEKEILDNEVAKRLAAEKIVTGDVYSAVAFYDNVVGNDPSNSDNYIQRANLKLNVKDFDGAIRDAEMALKMNADRGSAYFVEGQAFEGKNKPSYAYRAYSLALRENPENPEYRYHFAISANSVGRFSEANEILSLLLDSNASGYPKAYLERGKARYQMGEYYSAIADMTKYLGLKPKKEKAPEAYYYSAMSKLALKNPTDAIVDFNSAISEDRHNVEYYLNRATAYLALDEVKKASNDYKKIVDIKKAEATTEDHLRVAEAEVLSGNDKEALLYYDIIISKDKYNDNVYLDRARLYKKMGKNYDSINDYTTVLRLNPSQRVVYKERGLLLVSTKAYRKGILDLDIAIQDEPQNSQLYYFRALAKDATGHHDEALVDFDTAKRLENL
ncbi:MAG: tetratricopeptide repeat protein [Fusobacterium sp.]|nr:tetratricopeptide repeat protein [Fusobacterium sp.]